MLNISLAQFDIDTSRGFLPAIDPLIRLPDYFNSWETVVSNLSKLLILDKVKEEVKKIPLLDVDKLSNESEINRAMLVLSYLGHAYIWGGKNIVDTLPAMIARPWYEIAKHLGRPAVLSYASHALYNWKLYDTNKGIALDNIIRLENFFGGIDEDWFVLIHIAIEGQSAPGLQAILDAFKGVSENNIEGVLLALRTMSHTLHSINAILKKMPDKCDPYIYYNRVRNFIFGWMNNPELPQGVFYEGVKEWEGQGQKFRGETGAQSSIIPSFDAALGLQFDKSSPLYVHLLGLREYMPAKHRKFIEMVEDIEQTHSIRQFVIEHNAHQQLLIQYNECLDEIHDFREQHFNFAINYINRQVERKGSPTNTGTGGTPLVKYLKQHVDDVLDSKISYTPILESTN
jgi:indoleamine 2,3-dioxygenase